MSISMNTFKQCKISIFYKKINVYKKMHYYNLRYMSSE